MMVDQKNYRIVWEEIPQRWVPAHAASLAGVPLPHFVNGEAYQRFLNDKPIAFDRSMLLLGILYTWLEKDARWVMQDQHTLKSSIVTLVHNLCFISEFESLEGMLLSLGSKVREQNGRLPAIKILMAGHRLLPRSANLRSELIMDIWALVEATSQVDQQSAFGLIRHLYDGIEFETLDEQIFDILDYINFVALSYLGDYQKRNWLFWRVIAKRIRHKELKHQMIRLLNCRPVALTGEPAFWQPEIKAG